MKPCPFCGAMLAAALVAAIVDPSRDESCPRRPKRERKVDALVNGPRELVPGELFAKRMVAYALLGSRSVGLSERAIDEARELVTT